VVVAERHAGRAFAVSDLLNRNRIPYAFRDRASALGRDVLAHTGNPQGEVIVWMPAIGGTCLVDPTDAEIVAAWGIPTSLPAGTGRSTCCSSALGRPDWLRPSTPHPRACVPSSWNEKRSAVRRGPAR